MPNPLSTTFHQATCASAGGTLRDRFIGFLCARLSTLSVSRPLIRKLLLHILSTFDTAGRISLVWRLNGAPYRINIRTGNFSDYAVFSEMVLGAFHISDIQNRHPTTIIDGGANIGLFALQAHAAFPDVPITCYEIDGPNLELLATNLRQNSVLATVHQKAMWSETGRLFYHPAESYTGFVSRDESAFPIDCILPEILDGSWLKLDIEGAEHEVLPAVLASGRRPLVISIEIHDFPYRGKRLLDLLEASGYSWTERFAASEPCVNINAIFTG